MPGAAEVGGGVDYFRRTLDRLGVPIVQYADPAAHDVTLDATPGRPVVPELPREQGADRATDVVSAQDVLAGRVRPADHGQRVAVIGSGIFAGETALFLAAAGKPPVPVHRMPVALFRVGGLVSPMLRELADLTYQWTAPYVVDDAESRTRFGIEPTPWDEVCRRTAAGVA